MRPLSLADYEPAPGDVLAFSGRGPVAWLIHLATMSRYAHVAIVAEHGGRHLLFESTTLADAPCIIQGDRVSGPQAHNVHARIASAGCRVWLARPWWQLVPWESAMLTQWLLAQLGKGYDYREAAKSAGNVIKRLKTGTDSLWYCSEMVVAALQSIRRIAPPPRLQGPVDPSDYSPRRAMHSLTHRWQILQQPRRLAL